MWYTIEVAYTVAGRSVRRMETTMKAESSEQACELAKQACILENSQRRVIHVEITKEPTT